MASDKKWVVRAAALETIARRGDVRMLDAVIPNMKDKEIGVKYIAAAVVRLSTIRQLLKEQLLLE